MIRYLFFLQNFTTFLPLSIPFLPVHILLCFFFWLCFSFPIVSDAFLLICSSSPLIKHIFSGVTLLVALFSDFYQFVPFLLVHALKNRNIVVCIHIKDVESKNIIAEQKKWKGHIILRIVSILRDREQ